MYKITFWKCNTCNTRIEVPLKKKPKSHQGCDPGWWIWDGELVENTQLHMGV